MPVDAVLDEKGDIRINERGDLETVDGLDEFEQRLAYYLQQYHSNEIGGTMSRPNKIERLKMQTNRVVQEYDLIERVMEFEWDFPKPGEISLDIRFRADTGEMLDAGIDITDDPEFRKIDNDR